MGEWCSFLEFTACDPFAYNLFSKQHYYDVMAYL